MNERGPDEYGLRHGEIGKAHERDVEAADQRKRGDKNAGASKQDARERVTGKSRQSPV